MKRIALQILWVFLLAALAASGQTTTISSIRIYTVPDGARFYVDGTLYYASQTFLWPQGSKHTVQFPLDVVDGVTATYQTSVDRTIRYTFGGWADNAGHLQAGSNPTQVVTADPSLTSLSAAVGLQYQLSLRFSNTPTAPPGCGGAPGGPPQDAARSGLVYIGGNCYGANADLWVSAGTVTLNAYPYPGWVFTGWNVNGVLMSSYLSTFAIKGASIIYPVFALAHRVQFLTDPYGLQVLVDRTPTPTSAYWIIDNITNSSNCETGGSLPPNAPVGFAALCLGGFDFLPGSQHIFAAPTPQYDQKSQLWVFDSFSNGMTQNGVYTTPGNTNSIDTITAKFVKGLSISFLTSPNGLKLNVDGTTAWQSYNFAWATGSNHTVTAPATQADSNGRVWTFQQWSDGVTTPARTVSAVATAANRYTAVYSAQGQLKITTFPQGIKLQVDGADCTTPCTVNKMSGTNVAIVAPASIPQDANSRLDFQGWSDGGATVSRSFSFDANQTSLIATYGTSYRLALGSDPSDGVDFAVDPPSGDLFYAADSAVTVTAKARNGFKFRRWGGDAAGVYPTVYLKLSGPQAATAMLDRVPYIAPAGIRNAAGQTADGTVAPGSIIAIFGQSLAPDTAVGPTNPLAQAIANTVVTVNDRFLPLLFVSPTQINAQVLSDLPDGVYNLKVQTTGQAAVTGTFTISRTAPGLFSRQLDAAVVSLATHEDGSPISPDSPARRGETVSLYGTGFGAYSKTIIDGFIVPDASDYLVVAPVEVSAGDQTVQPVWAGAAPGYVGTAVTKVKIDDTFPAATNVDIVVKVNGKPSNKVTLPVE